MTKRGVLWVASSQKYVDEAILANEQLSLTNPNLSSALVSSEPDPGGFDHYININFERQNYGDKIAGMQCSPFDVTLFLDTDCYVLSDISDLFSLACKHDICCKLDPIRTKHLAKRLPPIYPELNSGVILYNNSSKTTRLLQAWSHNFDDFNLPIDMPSFSYTIHNSDIDLGVIPPVYNYTLQPQIAYGNVMILHVRLSDHGLEPNLQNIRELGAKLNKYQHLRVTRKVPFRKVKFEYVEVRGKFNLANQFLYSVWYNGFLYTLQQSIWHLLRR